MHNIKYIRDNFDEFKKKIQNRNVVFDLDKLKNLDVKNRELIHKKELIGPKMLLCLFLRKL